jgi:glyoxylase-like metal-dependent hydrolase (beta-lactamase superfamily II)
MTVTRRELLAQSGSCAAHLALAAAFSPAIARAAWARTPLGPVVAREPFGALEQVADGIWALVSTPLTGDRTTLSNGGIIAGRSGVLAIEGFNQPAGATWLAGKARELTGRWPTHVAVTHYHADHSNGIAAYVTASDRPVMRATDTTRDLVLTKNPADADRAAALRDVTRIAGDGPSRLDLGGRTVEFTPHDGHTASDVAIRVTDPSVTFCGDLVWNAMVPNYVDAAPSRLRKAVVALRQPGDTTTYVPGHGGLARAAAFDRYVEMLDAIEQGARAARTAGRPAADAAREFRLPPALGEWALLNPAFFERAFTAWYRDLGAP